MYCLNGFRLDLRCIRQVYLCNLNYICVFKRISSKKNGGQLFTLAENENKVIDSIV